MNNTTLLTVIENLNLNSEDREFILSFITIPDNTSATDIEKEILELLSK